MPPKKSPKEWNLILIDVNTTATDSALSNPIGISDFEISCSIADSLICRNIFSKSDELFSLVFFGFETATNSENQENGPNGFYIAADFENANFDVVEMLDDVKPGKKIAVSVEKAVEFAIKHIEGKEEESVQNAFSNVNVYFMSNLSCSSSQLLTKASAAELGKKIAKLMKVHFNIVSPDDVVNTKGPKMDFYTELATKCDAKWLTFSECQKKFASIVPKLVNPRGAPFNFQLDETTAIPVQLFTKNDDKCQLEYKFVGCSSDGKHTYKKATYHQINPEVVATMEEVDAIPDHEFQSNNFTKQRDAQKVVDKGNLIKGYNYGKTIVPADDAVIELFKPEKGKKELSLVMFTQAANIMPQFLLSSPRYILPAKDAATAQTVFSELVQEMINQDVVGIARYGYNAASHRRIVCLYPKISKTGIPVLIHYVLPHGEDCRHYEFPPLETDEKLSEYQMDSVDEFIETLMLVNPDGTDEKMRPKDLWDPKMQYQAALLRHKALNPSDTLPNSVDTTVVLKSISMPDSEERRNACEMIAAAFPLEINSATRHPLFMGRKIESAADGKILSDDEIKIKKSQGVTQ
ncbi:Methionine--tRNA ligase, mitochondrial [Aphelenchoides besseyi]|nr:Methionine--tRNA ligase, mitochondrial [Aphelenchoides besseyi]KAI6211569.1 Methionine--tRNA ligase, mitochondrial [Aphelenchoides besseyi]